MASGILRIALALIVVVHHLSSLGVGKACVYVFFVLSGYWIARMWNDKYRHCVQPWRTFVTARFLRLWPMFVVANLIGVAMLAAIGRPLVLPCGGERAVAECVQAIVANTVMLGYTSTPAQTIPPAWSLDVELQFYLVAPALLAALGTRARPWVVLATLPLALLDIWLLPETMLRFLPFFVFGMLAATGAIRIDHRLAVLSGWATAGLLVLPATTELGRSLLFTGARLGPLAPYNPLYNVLLGVFAAPFAVYFAGQQRDGRGAALGDIAFAIYIVHGIFVWPANQYGAGLPFAQRLPIVLGAVLATVLLALVLWRWVDHPLERWRRRLPAPRRQVGGEASQRSAVRAIDGRLSRY